MLARTRTREAVNHGRLNFAYEHDLDLFEIDTHESACPYCRQYVGRVYSITGATPGFPRLTVMPPYHPHCKCNGYPVPVEHLEAMPYFEELKRFSNDKNASFEEFVQFKEDSLKGTKYEILPFGTSGGIVVRGGQGNISSVSPGGGFFRVDRTGVPKGEYSELKRVLGNKLQVSGYDLETDDGTIVRRHLADLDDIPKALLAKTVNEGVNRVIIAPGSVAQFTGYSHLAKVQVPGYPVGTTWLDLAGGYDHEGGNILLGTSPVVEPHLVQHEFAHALIDRMGYANDYRVRKAYAELLPELDDFYTLGGASTRGRIEFLADSGVYAILNQQDRLSGFPDYFLDFLLNVMLKGKSPRVK